MFSRVLDIERALFYQGTVCSAPYNKVEQQMAVRVRWPRLRYARRLRLAVPGQQRAAHLSHLAVFTKLRVPARYNSEQRK